MPKVEKRKTVGSGSDSDVKSSSDSSSGPEDRNPPISKKVKKEPEKKKNEPEKKKKKQTSAEEDGSWQLDGNRFVKVREFKGKVMVDIREFYEKDGDLLPGRKGISLSAKQWKKLKSLIDDIDNKVNEM